MEMSEWIGQKVIFQACQSSWIELEIVVAFAGATPGVWRGRSAMQAAVMVVHLAT